MSSTRLLKALPPPTPACEASAGHRSAACGNDGRRTSISCVCVDSQCRSSRLLTQDSHAHYRRTSRRPILGPYQPRGDRAELAQKASAARRRHVGQISVGHASTGCALPHVTLLVLSSVCHRCYALLRCARYLLTCSSMSARRAFSSAPSISPTCARNRRQQTGRTATAPHVQHTSAKRAGASAHEEMARTPRCDARKLVEQTLKPPSRVRSLRHRERAMHACSKASSDDVRSFT